MPICPECRTGYPPGTTACARDGASLVEDGREAGAPALAVREASDPLVGATLAGRFQVTARIGHGGMGIVYRARHAVIGREVALKVLHERHVERREVAQRLMNEARLASAIHNEHIVDIFDFGETADGRTFVVMELLDGEPLSQVIRREGALPEARAIRIALQVADALGAAHARGIIHRDVKPENIFLVPRDGGDFVKVLDFGISKAVRGGDLEASLRLTHTGMVLGTPLYMSPEQARGEEKIDHRIDVYALGVILYESLTGEVPFRGSNYLGVISDVQSRVPVPPRQLRPDLGISSAIEQLVARAMAKERADRYPSMAELGEDLRRALAGEPLDPPPPAPRLRRRKALMYGSIAGVVALVTGATLLIARRPAPPVVAAATAARVGAAAANELSPAAAPPNAPPSSAPAVASGRVPAIAGAGAPPAALAPAATVEILVRTRPVGAAVLNGDRQLGLAPLAIRLPRSERAVRLTFRKEGYQPATRDVVPDRDAPIEVELRAQPTPARRRPAAQASNAQEKPPAPWPGPRRLRSGAK